MSEHAATPASDFATALIEQVKGQVLQALDASENPWWRDLEGTATFYGVEPRQVRLWRELGLKGRKVGRRLMFDCSPGGEVDRWIDSQEKV